jgi:hypothetical protein
MRNPDGSFSCDKCGADVGNGGVTVCTNVSRVVEGPAVENLMFCLDREVEGKTIKGCSNKVLSKTNLAHYHKTKESRDDGSSGSH